MMIKSIVKRLICLVVPEKIVRDVRVDKVAILRGEVLVGKTVFITGGSVGLGFAMARKFIDEGAYVIISGRDEDRLIAAVAKLESPRVHYIVWDVTDVRGVDGHILKLQELAPNGIDVLVNNAGVANREKFGALTDENWDRVFETNLKGLVFITQAIVNRWLKTSKSGVVLNIVSFAAFEHNEDAYSLSKSALVALTRGLGRKYAGHGIRVNAIAPGVIVGTEVNPIQRSIDPSGNLSCDWIPVGRYGVPEEVAELAAFLISDASAYVFGQTIVADGAASL